MSAERYTFDANVLFYSIDSRDHAKHQLARRLVGLANPKDIVVMVQVLGELCNAMARKRPELLWLAEEAVQALPELFSTVSVSVEDIQQALQARAKHHLQFWDAVLWAAAQRSGCRVLLTEDMQDGRTLGNVTFRNPFAMTDNELDSFFN